MGIKKSKKLDSKIVYITVKDKIAASDIFKRTTLIRNEEVRVTQFIPPQIFERFRSLQYNCKLQRDTNKELKTKVLLGINDLVLRVKLKTETYWTTIFNLEEFGPIRDLEMYRNWPNSEEQEKEFSPAKGRRRTTKHHLTPSPQDKRNVKQKTDDNTTEDDSDKNDAVDDELREKFKKIKGKNK